jgi:hypothetical protein
MTVRLVVIGALALALLAAGVIAAHRIHSAGQAQARQEQQERDNAALKAGEAARRAHELVCARGEPQCLRDAWTRD